MSKMAELDYDIQELYIEGHSARVIAVMLECPIELVLGTLESMSVSDSGEELSPYETMNS